MPVNAFCMMCGTPLEAGFRFCARCGAAVPDAPGSPAAMAPQPAPAPPAARPPAPAPPPSPPLPPAAGPVAAPQPGAGAPVRSWEELQQTRAIEYVESALAVAVAESKGWFEPADFSELITRELVGHLRPLDRVDLFVPAVIEVGCAQMSCADREEVKPAGELTPGLIVARDHDVILAWASGVVRFRTGSLVVPYASVRSAAPFTIRAKLSTLPAAEVITDAGRVAFTFSNNLHDEAGADPTGWRDTLVDRFRGAAPVFEGYRVVSRTSPPSPAATPAEPAAAAADPVVGEAAPVAPAAVGGWHPDPWRVATYRWHDGVEWTEHTS